MEPTGLGKKQAELCKNMFTLGVVSWLYDRSIDPIRIYIDKRYSKRRPEMAEANKLALQAGYNYADTIEVPDQFCQAAGGHLPQDHGK